MSVATSLTKTPIRGKPTYGESSTKPTIANLGEVPELGYDITPQSSGGPPRTPDASSFENGLLNGIVFDSTPSKVPSCGNLFHLKNDDLRVRKLAIPRSRLKPAGPVQREFYVAPHETVIRDETLGTILPYDTIDRIQKHPARCVSENITRRGRCKNPCYRSKEAMVLLIELSKMNKAWDFVQFEPHLIKIISLVMCNSGKHGEIAKDRISEYAAMVTNCRTQIQRRNMARFTREDQIAVKYWMKKLMTIPEKPLPESQPVKTVIEQDNDHTSFFKTMNGRPELSNDQQNDSVTKPGRGDALSVNLARVPVVQSIPLKMPEGSSTTSSIEDVLRSDYTNSACPSSISPGHFLVYLIQGKDSRFKLAWTSETPENYTALQQRHCQHNTITHRILKPYPINGGAPVFARHAKRIIELVRIELKSYSRVEPMCEKCNLPPEEWFHVSFIVVEEVLQKWARWMNEHDPYHLSTQKESIWCLKPSISDEQIEEICTPVTFRIEDFLDKPGQSQFRSALQSGSRRPITAWSVTDDPLLIMSGVLKRFYASTQSKLDGKGENYYHRDTITQDPEDNLIVAAKHAAEERRLAVPKTRKSGKVDTDQHVKEVLGANGAPDTKVNMIESKSEAKRSKIKQSEKHTSASSSTSTTANISTVSAKSSTILESATIDQERNDRYQTSSEMTATESSLLDHIAHEHEKRLEADQNNDITHSQSLNDKLDVHDQNNESDMTSLLDETAVPDPDTTTVRVVPSSSTPTTPILHQSNAHKPVIRNMTRTLNVPHIDLDSAAAAATAVTTTTDIDSIPPPVPPAPSRSPPTPPPPPPPPTEASTQHKTQSQARSLSPTTENDSSNTPITATTIETANTNFNDRLIVAEKPRRRSNLGRRIRKGTANVLVKVAQKLRDVE